MAFWIEIRCEGGYGEVDKDDNIIRDENVNCSSFSNSDPGILVNDTIQSLLEGKKHIEEEAREYGYKRTRKGWFCPSCAALNRHKPVP